MNPTFRFRSFLRSTLAAAAFLLLAAARPAVAAPPELSVAAPALARELAAALARRPEGAGVHVVAIRAFSAPAGLARAGETAADQVGAGLASAGLKTRDRAAIAAVAAERRLLLSSDRDPELARLAGAQALLTGALREAGDGVLLQAQLISVSTGAVLASASQPAATPRAAPLRLAGAVESQSIEVAMRKLSDSLAGGFERLPGNARYRRLAVLPFGDQGEGAQKRQVGKIVAAEVATDLRRDHDLLLVERARLTEVMGELKLQQSGALDDREASQLGKLADAQALVIGTASDLGDRYLVNARVVATETGETLAAASASVNAAGMVALASDAVVLRSRKDAMFRSLLLPGFGQFYNRQPAKAFTVIGLETALLGGALIFHLAGNRAYDQYSSRTTAVKLGGDPSAAAQSLYDTSTMRYRWRNGLLLGAAGVWLLNVVDAYASGVDGDDLLGGGSAPSGRTAQATPPARRLGLSSDGQSLVASLRF